LTSTTIVVYVTGVVRRVIGHILELLPKIDSSGHSLCSTGKHRSIVVVTEKIHCFVTIANIFPRFNEIIIIFSPVNKLVSITSK